MNKLLCNSNIARALFKATCEMMPERYPGPIKEGDELTFSNRPGLKVVAGPLVSAWPSYYETGDKTIKPLDIYDIYMNASATQASRDKVASNVPYPFPVSPSPAKQPEDKADTINPQLLSKRLRDW